VHQELDPFEENEEQIKVKKSKDKAASPKIITKDDLFQEILKQNTYTDIVDAILKYLKSIKGSPNDLVDLLEFIKLKIIEQIHAFQNQIENEQKEVEVITKQKVDERDGSKILKLC
jgi:hypothetical protein